MASSRVDEGIRCPLGQFPCGNMSECLPQALQCNGHKDCPNGADERRCGECVRCMETRTSTLCGLAKGYGWQKNNQQEGFYFCVIISHDRSNVVFFPLKESNTFLPSGTQIIQCSSQQDICAILEKQTFNWREKEKSKMAANSEDHYDDH